MDSVVIGADPHKHSVTIEVLDERERVLHQGRYGTDTDGYRQMLTVARRYPRRRWAVEGCSGIGKHVAQRLVADGETVLDVPAKLAARVRVFDTGNGRKSDPADAHSVAMVALRSQNLTVVRPDDHLVALRLLVDRRDELARTRTRTVNRLHKLLLELVPGGAKRFLTAAQAKTILDTVRPAEPDVAGRVRHQLATELLDEIVVLDQKMKDSDKALRKAVGATGTGLLNLNGIGPAGAARILGDVLDVTRFATRAQFASWNGTAPLDASSGEQKRHRLSRAGNRRINRALHIMAIVQIRHDTDGRAYYRRRVAAGKTPMEALRALNDDSPMWSTASSSPTRRRRARPDTRRRLRHPAWPTPLRRSALPTSHSPGSPPSLPRPPRQTSPRTRPAKMLPGRSHRRRGALPRAVDQLEQHLLQPNQIRTSPHPRVTVLSQHRRDVQRQTVGEPGIATAHRPAQRIHRQRLPTRLNNDNFAVRLIAQNSS